MFNLFFMKMDRTNVFNEKYLSCICLFCTTFRLKILSVPITKGEITKNYTHCLVGESEQLQNKKSMLVNHKIKIKKKIYK